MKSFKTLIIEDERLAREELKLLLKDYLEIEIIGEAKNGEEGLQKIKEEKPDLLFLDVSMPGMTGFEMLKHLEEIPRVIFITAYDEYAMKAFEVNALDYILKPVDPDRLKEAIAKLTAPEDDFISNQAESLSRKNRQLTLNDRVFIKDGEKCWFIELSKVRMLESEGNYVKVYFDNFKPLILRSLNSFEDRLDSEYFFRANRKFIINLNWVSNIENWFNGGLQVELRDGEKVEISRRQAIRFKELLSI
ncbi:MAG: LytTR family DNA-binding domain-containing protein [Crocinitomicaceae bacterium]|nr:LytTR family DNA-binding domain-containing protein [Crocinitomicaceae bacterium]MDP5011901.1 LytTR family DNA-binding domain-containing protein [Crocinitomicaceae bacterium]